jgi:hypothetical protein
MRYVYGTVCSFTLQIAAIGETSHFPLAYIRSVVDNYTMHFIKQC